FQAEDGIRDRNVTGVQTCALPIFFPLTKGVSYNSYLLLDEKTVLFDSADYSIGRQFLENVKAVLDGRTLDYLVVDHMEPDHCAKIGRASCRERGEGSEMAWAV